MTNDKEDKGEAEVRDLVFILPVKLFIRSFRYIYGELQKIYKISDIDDNILQLHIEAENCSSVWTRGNLLCVVDDLLF